MKDKSNYPLDPAYRVSCPMCGALPFFVCHKKTGKPHIARIRKALAERRD